MPFPSSGFLLSGTLAGPVHAVLGGVLGGVLEDPRTHRLPGDPELRSPTAYVRLPPPARYNATTSFRNSDG